MTQQPLLRFYMTPGSCSTGIHILLEEVGLIFEAHLVNLLTGEHHKPAYRQLNPKGTIPTLVLEDGTVLTDFLSIAWWLAKLYPHRRLIPENLLGELRVLEASNHAVNILHGQGFARIFTPEKFSTSTADLDTVKIVGEIILNENFAIVNKQLEGQDYIAGNFSIADAALFYVEFWADRTGISLPPHCENHYRRMLKRPAVRQVLSEEGYGHLFR